jgi:DNA-binding beta-propeller fold protein YncE
MKTKYAYLLKAICIVLISSVFTVACEEPTPLMTGRLNGPVDIAAIEGCPQSFIECSQLSKRPLLLILNSLGDELRVFDVNNQSFFSAPNPLFPLSIPVGEYPRSFAVDPHMEFAFVANNLSADVSLVSLDPAVFVELDADNDSTTCFCQDLDGESCQDSTSNQCQAGVSRVGLGGDPFSFPEDIVTLSNWQDSADDRWDPSQPLPVYVSLPGSGQVAALSFYYPDPDNNSLPRMELVELINVGGRPSGMALTQDGSTLFVADEDSSAIVVVNCTDNSFEYVEVGGPSRRMAMTIDTATDPEGEHEYIKLPGVPQSLTFVVGQAVLVVDESGLTKNYTNEMLKTSELAEMVEQDPEFKEEVIKTFAYVSDLNGSVYLIDAKNHRVVDEYPFIGPNVTTAP